MARNEKIPFSKEFDVSSKGYIGDETGMYVPDILSLAIDITEGKVADVIVYGKISAGGDWNSVYSKTKISKVSRLNISEYSYIKVYVKTTKPIRVVLFGYHYLENENPVISLNEKDSERLFMNNVYLKDIIVELKAMNEKLNIIIEE